MCVCVWGVCILCVSVCGVSICVGVCEGCVCVCGVVCVWVWLCVL